MSHRIRGLLFLSLLLATQVQAAVVINEVRPWSGSSGLEETIPSAFWLLNTGNSAIDLGSWEVRSYVSPAFTHVLPSIMLPPEAYLQVIMESGTDDLDFSDGEGLHYLGDIAFLRKPSGELGLYTGSSNSSIVDYVRWGYGGSTSGTGQSHASAQGIWSPSPNDYVELQGDALFANIARVPSGYDNDVVSDWQEYELRTTQPLDQHKHLQLSPPHASEQAAVNMLEWRDVPDADSFLVQVDDDSDFTSPALSIFTSATSLAVALDDGYFFWRVIPYIGGLQWIRNAIAAFAQNTIQGIALTNFAQSLQNKDSEIMCLYKYKDGVFVDSIVTGEINANDKRPGCKEGDGENGPWWLPHSLDPAHIRTCNHCGMYCTRGSLKMINEYFRRLQEGASYAPATQMTQDEISYYIKWNSYHADKPEDDLGHGEGANAHTNDAFSFTLNGTPIVNNLAALPFGVLVNEIQSGRPVLVSIKNKGGGTHAIVLVGAGDDIFGREWALVADPWPGETGWKEFSKLDIFRYYIINAAANQVFARLGNPDVWNDTDGDGLMDFDEGGGMQWQANNPLPRRIPSRKTLWDTDGDCIGDPQEIRSYTFHDTDHPDLDGDEDTEDPHDNDPINFPDVDGDGLRAEVDMNTDNDNLHDRAEDANANGNSPQDGETCVYLRADGIGNVASHCNMTQMPIAPQGVTNFVINVPNQYIITEVELVLGFNHHSTEDLLVDLRSPAGTTLRVLNRLCNGGIVHGNRTFWGHWEDQAPQVTLCQFAGSYTGWYKPQQVFAAFNGEDARGDWQIRFEGLRNDYFGGGDTAYCACLIIRWDQELPVELLSFEAFPGDEEVLLRWQTASELENDHFDIERDGRLVAQVDGAGSSSEMHYYSWRDREVQNGTTYRYTLFSVSIGGEREEKGSVDATPAEGAAIITDYALYQNYPNPFNPTTKIVFDLVEAGNVSLRVYNLLGQEVLILVNAERNAGRHVVQLESENLPSGVYVYKLEVNGFSDAKKMLLLK